METKTTILELTWPDYFQEITSETLKNCPQIFKRRLALISAAKKLFESKAFCDMSEDERKLIAGMRNRLSEEILQAFDPIEGEKKWGWFGSMEGAGSFMYEIIANNKHLSQALDEIPMTGQVTRQHFLNFWETFRNIFTKNYIAPPTRLLCMKRPDVFVCLDSANKDNICKNFKIKKTGIDGCYYWDKIIARIFTCEWWKNATPNRNNPDEIAISNARVAFLDSLVYERTNINSNLKGVV